MSEELRFTADDLSQWLACSAEARDRVWMQSGFFADRVSEVKGWVVKDRYAIERRGVPLSGEIDDGEALCIASDAVLDALRTAKPHDPEFGGEPVRHDFRDPRALLHYVRKCTRPRVKDELIRRANAPVSSFDDLGSPGDEDVIPLDRFEARTVDPLAGIARAQAWAASEVLVADFSKFVAANRRATGLRAHFEFLTASYPARPTHLVLDLLGDREAPDELHRRAAEQPGFEQDTFNSRDRRLREQFRKYRDGEGAAQWKRLEEALT